MKKIIMLLILIMTIINCSYIEAAREERRRRGRICYYNHKGDFQGCRYADE